MGVGFLLVGGKISTHAGHLTGDFFQLQYFPGCSMGKQLVLL